MYVTGPDGVYGLVPETGELLWEYDAAPVALRGLAYWPGAGGWHPRVFTGNGLFLLALDVTTGKPAPGFGNEGRVDLRKGVLGDLKDGRYALQSPPAVFGDVVITGCSNGEGTPSAGAYGDIRGWDAKTGKLLWTFHTVARPGEPGSETWSSGSWKNRSGTNVWGFFTIDAQRGIVYAPLGSPTSDFYGADRIGDDLYGDSLVALDARTGERKWHQQLVHHDLWDYDLPRRRRCLIFAAAAGRSGGRRDHQDGFVVRVRPRDRGASLRDGRTACASNGGARGSDF